MFALRRSCPTIGELLGRAPVRQGEPVTINLRKSAIRLWRWRPYRYLVTVNMRARTCTVRHVRALYTVAGYSVAVFGCLRMAAYPLSTTWVTDTRPLPSYPAR